LENITLFAVQDGPTTFVSVYLAWFKKFTWWN